MTHLEPSNKKILFLDSKNIEGAIIPPFPLQVTTMLTEKLVTMNMTEEILLWSHFPTITSTVVIISELMA
jgi:hypothetical protein